MLYLFLMILAVRYYVSGYTQESSLHLLVMVSIPSERETNATAQDSASVPNWERGHEILPGALLAADKVNSSDLLPGGYDLEIVPIITTKCNINSGLVDYVKTLATVKNIVGVVGYFCNNIANTFSSLVGARKSYAIQISASTDYPPTRSQETGLYYVLPPLTAYAKALVSLLNQLGWSRIAVLKTSAYHDTYYSTLAEAFGQLFGSERIIYKNQVDDRTIKFNLTELWRSGSKVVIGFLVPSDASKVICSAYREELTWPNYVWVMVDNNVDDLLNCDNNDTTLKAALENIIFVHRYPSSDTALPSRKNDQNYFENERKNNYYANVLYDSVWAIGLALNSSLEIIKSSSVSLAGVVQENKDAINIIKEELANIAFQGATGFVNFSQSVPIQTSVGIFQFQQGQTIKLGAYNTSHHLLTLNVSLLGDIPSDELEKVYEIYPLILTIFLSILAITGLVFTTGILVLFIHFRAEPEIKASSRYLSLCMFFGCYTLLLASLDYTILSGIVIPQENMVIRAVACVVDISLASIGLDLVLATLFAKMLRVYHIFKKFGKVSHLWSDNGLFALIIFIILVKVSFLIVWTFVDIYHVLDVETIEMDSVPPYYTVIQKCHCEYFEMWITLNFLYTGTLFTVLLLVAFNTRKIKRANFKDTKKVNLLIATLVGVVVFSFTGWAILRFIENNASKVIVSIGFAVTAMLCQGFLLVPKVIPPIRRHFQKTFTTEPVTISTEASSK